MLGSPVHERSAPQRFSGGRRVLLVVALALVAFLVSPQVAPPAAAAPPIAARLCNDLTGGRFTMELLGDSVAAGYPGAPNEWDRWWNVFSRALPPGSALWNGSVPATRLVDYLPAHNGIPAGRIAFHTQFARENHPSLVAINHRLNDQGFQVPIAQFKADYRLLINYVRQSSPDATFMFLVSPLSLDPKHEQAGPIKAADYIRALVELNAETPGSLLVRWDLFMPTPPTDWFGLLIYDLVHPSPAGQRLLAAQTYQALTSYCQGRTGG